MSVLKNAGISRLIQELARQAVDYLEHVDERPVRADLGIAELRALLPGVLQDAPIDPLSVVQQLATLGASATVATTGPRYFGFVNGGSLPAALGADLLASVWDQNGAMAVMSPMSSVTEEVAARWLLELLHLPLEASIGFVTGGQGANTTCLSVACHHVLAAEGWDLKSQGLFDAPRIRVMVGAQRHATIDVSLSLLGLGAATDIVAADGQGRMLPGELETVLAKTSGPTIVCAQAGNVNTGAFDPFEEISRLCRDHSAWLHVDGAFGLWAAASPAHRHLLKGVEQADSWSTDGHKWLNVPYDCGYAITAHPHSHRKAFGSTASYYVLGGEDLPRDGMNFVPEASRRARGLATWAALRSLGREGIAELVQRCCALARQMSKRLSAESGIEILNEVVVNQVLVRFADNDECTRAVIEAIQREGTCWAGGSTWEGQAVMRLSVSNWSTTAQDIDRSADAIITAHRRLQV